MTQKFQRGDRVRIADDLGSTMRHFTKGCEAIVIGSYADQFGRGGTDSYTVYLERSGECSWYPESGLTLIERDRGDLLERWRANREADIAEKSDLNWIFAHGAEVLEHYHGASIAALARCLGCDNLWGSNGEGITYYTNSMATISHAAPYLRTGDREGWERYAATFRSARNERK